MIIRPLRQDEEGGSNRAITMLTVVVLIKYQYLGNVECLVLWHPNSQCHEVEHNKDAPITEIELRSIIKHAVDRTLTKQELVRLGSCVLIVFSTRGWCQNTSTDWTKSPLGNVQALRCCMPPPHGTSGIRYCGLAK